MIGIDLYALLILAAALLLLYFLSKRWKKQNEAFEFSRVRALKRLPETARLRLLWLEPFCYFAGLTALALGFLDPHSWKSADKRARPPLEGRAIYLVVDQSGSMGQTSELLETKDGLVKQTKLQNLQRLMLPFIDRHADDLIGLVAFSRGAQVLSPLTADHESLKQKLEKMQVVTDPAQNGTAIGYALYKTVSLIASTKGEGSVYQIRDPVIIIVTDGLQDPNPQDFKNPYRTIGMEEAAHFAKENGVRVYMINLEPKLLEENFKPNLREMQRAMELAQGKIVFATTPDALGPSLREIEQLEKSTIASHRYSPQQQKISFAPFFIIVGLVLLIASWIFSETYLRRIP